MLYYIHKVKKDEVINMMMTSESEKKMYELWDYMVECGIATTEEIELATALCGGTLETLERVLYIKTDYCSLEQLMEEEED